MTNPKDLPDPKPAEDDIDEALEESFPASDPPSWPATRIGEPKADEDQG